MTWRLAEYSTANKKEKATLRRLRGWVMITGDPNPSSIPTNKHEWGLKGGGDKFPKTWYTWAWGSAQWRWDPVISGFENQWDLMQGKAGALWEAKSRLLEDQEAVCHSTGPVLPSYQNQTFTTKIKNYRPVSLMNIHTKSSTKY